MVVIRSEIRKREREGFDMEEIGRKGKIGNGGILSLEREMRNKGGVKRIVGGLERVKSLRKRKDMVKIEENWVGEEKKDKVKKKRRISKEKIVEEKMEIIEDKIGKIFKELKIVLRNKVLNGEDRIVDGKIGEIIGMRIRIEGIEIELIEVVEVIEEIGRREVKEKRNILERIEKRIINRLNDEIEWGMWIIEVWRKEELVEEIGVM